MCALGRIARVPQLFVACDYDGTSTGFIDEILQVATARDAAPA